MNLSSLSLIISLLTFNIVAVFLKISKAHEILMDEAKRAAYDGTLKAKKLKKRKEMEMDANRKKMKDGTIIILKNYFI